MRRLLGALLLLGGLSIAAPPAHGQYCGSVGGNTTTLTVVSAYDTYEVLRISKGGW